ncbi:MAG: sulfurtransferase [Halobacteria archaeon]
MDAFLVTPAWLKERISDPRVRVVDARKPMDYAAGHIPGAVNIPAGEFIEMRGRVATLPPKERVEQMLGSRSIANDSLVVAYDDRFGTLAGRFLYTLAYFGHRDLAILNRNFDQYALQGNPVETGVPAVAPAQYRASSPAPIRATKEEVLARSGNGGSRLVDTRAPNEYMMGHIPNSVNVPWMAGAARDRIFRPPEELKKLFAERGLKPDDEVICYCNMGMTSSHTYWALRLAGFTKVKMYPESMGEWMMDGKLPVARASFGGEHGR